MSVSCEYDDSNLQKLFADLEPKRRMQALKGGIRRTANIVRKAAVANLRASMRSNRKLEKGIRAIVFKRKAGFRVTVGTGKNNKGFYQSSRRKDNRYLPVLMWAEDGTDQRNRGSRRKILGIVSRRGASTGRMPRYGFIAATASQVRGEVTETMHREIAESVRRTARKYGGS